jgi:phosphopantothenoylcysteine decarboxylase/phosphopantothenate--cysteine ligase
MNVNMWENKIVQKNIATLVSHGWEVIEPASGVLACNYEGKGKLAHVDDIIKHIKGDKPFKGKKVVITSGGTIEDIDPVRYITNRSSGTMGIRFAEASRDMGAEVILIHGSMKYDVPGGVKGIGVRSALDMLEALRETLKDADVLIMAAAVADFRVKSVSDEKVKKKEGEDDFSLELVKNPDILKTLKPEIKKTKVVAFALESQNLMENAEKKLREKGADMLVANSTKEEVSPFGGETSRVYLLHKDGKKDDFGLLSKKETAYKVLIEVLRTLK